MTYSIVARDPASGAFGVAVQSHYFGVGPVVPWLEAGVGAVATQAAANVAFGPDGLSLLRAGTPADVVVDTLVAADPRAAERQLAVVDPAGRAAAHTGASCIRHAGHRVGDGFSVQGNLLRTPDVWPSMAAAYRSSGALPFWERLLAALDAAEAAGGDIRGRQSAALVIVGGSVGAAPPGRLLDVRVDDHPDPLAELRRLARVSEAYRILGELEAPVDDGRPAAERYADARRLAPDAHELVFWRAIELGRAGELDAARRELGIALAADPTWAEVLRRVADAGLVGDDPGLVERLLGAS